MLPSLFILIALSWIYLRFGDVPVVAGIFYGIKPAVTALVLHAAHRIGTRALKNALDVGHRGGGLRGDLRLRHAVSGHRRWRPALIGHFGARRAPAVFALGGGHGGAQAELRPGADRRRHADAGARALLARPPGAACWPSAWRCGPLAMGALVATQGWQGTLTQMGWFFTKAALLTFGGAYAVLPYVYQGAVEQHHWLSGAQMIDGLALGETTPGPLIMVVAFVGFVGGWRKQVLGPDALVPRRRAGRHGGHLLHLPAVLRLHPRRRAAGRGDARQAAASPRRCRRSPRRWSA